jgi:hypothetical protein
MFTLMLVFIAFFRGLFAVLFLLVRWDCHSGLIPSYSSSKYTLKKMINDDLIELIFRLLAKTRATRRSSMVAKSMVDETNFTSETSTYIRLDPVFCLHLKLTYFRSVSLSFTRVTTSKTRRIVEDLSFYKRLCGQRLLLNCSSFYGC